MRWCSEFPRALEQRKGSTPTTNWRIAGARGKVSWSPRIGSSGVTAGQLLQQLFAQAVEAAVGHDEQQIAGYCFDRKQISDAVCAGKDAGILAKLADGGRDSFRVETLILGELTGAMDASKKHFVAQRERLRQGVLKDF